MIPDAFLNFALAHKYFRTRSGMTQDMLAQQSGVSLRSISDLERGISRSPRKETVKLLAEAMHLSEKEIELLISLATPSARTGYGSLALSTADLPLIGREREMREILDLLTNPATRLLTLTGGAGVGKTRLALECAAQLQETFSNAIVMVDLASISTHRFALPAIIETLKLHAQSPRSLLDIIADAIAEQRMLMILDNCGHVLEIRSEIGLLLERCPNVLFLATSREKLGITLEQVWHVPPLAIPEDLSMSEDAAIDTYPAIILFLSWVRAMDPDFSPLPSQMRTIAKICMLLDGIPLAIELAASRVPSLSLRTIQAQLSSTTHRSILKWLRPSKDRLHIHQQTLHDALAWSYQLLMPREQIAFRRLSAFSDGWSVEAAEAVVDPQGTMAIDAILSSLMEKSLIVQDIVASGIDRFRMHFVVRSFGMEVLKERKEGSIVARIIADWYASLVERLEQGLTGATQSESLHRLIQEYENIRASLQWTKEQNESTIGLRIAGSLWWFWENRGDLTEGREWLEGMLSQWQHRLAGIDHEIVARAYYGATILSIIQGDVDKGDKFAQICLRWNPSPEKHARILLMQGNLAKRSGDNDNAFAHYSRGLMILREVGDIKGLLVALNNLSTLFIERGEIEQGIALLEESLELKRSVGDRRGVAVGLINQGEAFKAMKDFVHARSSTQAGLDIFLDLGDIHGIVIASSNLGEIAEDLADNESAIAAYTQSVTYARRMEDHSTLATALYHLGNVCARQHDPLAMTYLQESMSLFQELGDINGIVMVTLERISLLHEKQAWKAVNEEIARISPLLPHANTTNQQYATILLGKIHQKANDQE